VFYLTNHWLKAIAHGYGRLMSISQLLPDVQYLHGNFFSIFSDNSWTTVKVRVFDRPRPNPDYMSCEITEKLRK